MSIWVQGIFPPYPRGLLGSPPAVELGEVQAVWYNSGWLRMRGLGCCRERFCQSFPSQTCPILWSLGPCPKTPFHGSRMPSQLPLPAPMPLGSILTTIGSSGAGCNAVRMVQAIPLAQRLSNSHK